MTGLISDLADKVLGHIKVCLANSRMIGITTDIWSTKCGKDSFLGVTTHSYNHKLGRRQSFKICKYF